MSPEPSRSSRPQVLLAVAVSVLCAVVAWQLQDRRADERDLRAANVAGAAGRFDEATRLASGLREGTTAADAWYLRAQVALISGNLRGARTALDRSIARRPNDWRALRDLATVLQRLGDDRGAGTAYARAIALNPRMRDPFPVIPRLP